MTTEVDSNPTDSAPRAANDSVPPPPDSTPPPAPDSVPPPGELFPREEAKAPEGDEHELAQAAQDDVAQLKEAARFAPPERVRAVIEALLFAADKPLEPAQLQETTLFSAEQVSQALSELLARYAPQAGGVQLFDLGGRYQLRTEPTVGQYVRRMLQVKPMRLTRAALETLAIIAYRQPITRPEMEDLRGVDCGAVVKALLERKLVRILGKKDEPGRPLLYGTSKEFLDFFNLRDLTQLPTLREFQELSEENRKIVEEEAPAQVPPVAGLTELAHDPALSERMAKATQESDAALEQLEKAIESADEQAKAAAQALAPPAPAAAPGTEPNPGAAPPPPQPASGEPPQEG